MKTIFTYNEAKWQQNVTQNIINCFINVLIMLDRSHVWIHYTTKKDLDDGIRNLCFVNVLCAAAACNVISVILRTNYYRENQFEFFNVHHCKLIFK